jgi:hypothetical protein
MNLIRSSRRLFLGLATLGSVGCHEVCEHDIVAEGTTYRVTVKAPSIDCPELLPLKAGDTLTFRAGAVISRTGDGGCTGNASAGAPPELPQYPASPFSLGRCQGGRIGFLGFECSVTAPECASGDITRPGTIRVSGIGVRPKWGEVLDSEFTITLGVGADTACLSACLTKIPITIQLI